MVKELKTGEIEIKPWTIYLWRDGDKMEGASPVVTKDGVKQIYQVGWEIEEDPESKKNEDRHKAWRARNSLKSLLNNTLNVINWYDKKVLNKNGDVNPKKLYNLEIKTAKEAVKINNVRKYGKGILNKKGEIVPSKLQKAEEKMGKLKSGKVSMNDIHRMIYYPIKDITLKEAKKNGFK
jgi:hypothetical protein